MWLLLACASLSGLGDPVSGEEEAWAALTKEARTLVARTLEARGFTYGALLRSFYTFSEAEAGAGTEDLSGHVLEDADVFAAGENESLAWRLSADLDTGSFVLEDAYASWRHAPYFELKLGQFKPRVVRSASLGPDALLLRERTFLGSAFDGWDDGLEVGGHYDQFDYWLALTDAGNGSESDHFASARGEWALYDVAIEDVEGARTSPNHLRALLGASWFTDVAQSAADASGYAFDLALTFGPYAFHGEWASLDEAFARTVDAFNGHLLTVGDGEPLAATLARRVGASGEASARYQRADDADSTEAFGFGLGWNPAGGAARFQAEVEFVEADSRDFSLFSVGVSLGASGLNRPFQGGGVR